jgi:hypothetical protein
MARFETAAGRSATCNRLALRGANAVSEPGIQGFPDVQLHI